MNRGIMSGWRRVEEVNLSEDVYFSLCPKIGRGVIKKIDGDWFFIFGSRSNSTSIPMIDLKNVFCLYRLR